MLNQVYTRDTSMATPPFDARDHPVKVGRPETPESVRSAKEAMFRERSHFIREYARRGGLCGLQAIVDVYGEEGLAVLIEYDRMCDQNGPATMSRLLQVFRIERGAR